MGVALEWEREQRRLMEESLRNDEFALREKELERSMLIGKKEGMLTEIKTQEKLIDDFMVFIGAVENNDLQIAQNFDEKAMMDAVVNMNGAGNYGGNGGGFGGLYGRGNKGIEIAQDPDEAVMVAIEGTGSEDGEGSNAGGKGGN